MDLFEKALAFVLRWEGGYVNNPADRGGPTNKGITQATYNAWLLAQHKGGQGVRSVALITDSEVKEIYRTRYWLPLLPLGLSPAFLFAAFDMAVNSGVHTADLYIHRANKDLIAFLSWRLYLYRRLARMPNQAQFLAGWKNRLASVCHALGIDFNEVVKAEVHLEV